MNSKQIRGVGLAALRPGFRAPSVLVAVSATWIVVPTLFLLILIPAVIEGVYRPRYLSVAAPAVALLLGLSICSLMQFVLPKKWSNAGITALLLGFVLLAAPTYTAQRALYSRDSIDYGAVGEIVDRYASPGDCLAVDDTPVPDRSWRLQLLLGFNPDLYQQKLEVLTHRHRAPFGRFDWSTVAISDWGAKLIGCKALWTISVRDNALREHQQGTDLPPGLVLAKTEAYQVPRKFVFRIVERWQFRTSQVTKSTR